MKVGIVQVNWSTPKVLRTCQMFDCYCILHAVCTVYNISMKAYPGIVCVKFAGITINVLGVKDIACIVDK